ncbi:MAG: hypothetical protein QOH73_1037, partial [Gaiellaceae bacterium]|nr:hypothetical protein [Gaiellaceae bacterium]
MTVEIAASCVSPGTERAQYLRLPNARPPFPFTPGYSAAGHVVAIGPGVTDLAPGDLVALPKVPHASVVTAPVEEVYRVGSSVAPQEAALVYLAIIAGYGLSCGELAAAEDVCVVGTGPIGALAQRMALARGAGTTTVIAASRRREGLAMTGGASAFLVAGEDDAAIAALGAALVVDATGEPDALATALAAAGEGARVVLLGSPRGVTRDFPSGELRRKGLTLVGAHISTIVRRGRERGVDLIRTEGEAFLAALANGLRVADLAGGPVDPREADAFYRSLANSQSLGAFFDWTALPQDQRLRRRRIWARPATDARGAAYAGEPLP